MPITPGEAKLGLANISDELISESTAWPRHRQLVIVQNKLLSVIFGGLELEWTDIQREAEMEAEQRLSDQRGQTLSDVRGESRHLVSVRELIQTWKMEMEVKALPEKGLRKIVKII